MSGMKEELCPEVFGCRPGSLTDAPPWLPLSAMLQRGEGGGGGGGVEVTSAD